MTANASTDWKPIFINTQERSTSAVPHLDHKVSEKKTMKNEVNQVKCICSLCYKRFKNEVTPSSDASSLIPACQDDLTERTATRGSSLSRSCSDMLSTPSQSTQPPVRDEHALIFQYIRKQHAAPRMQFITEMLQICEISNEQQASRNATHAARQKVAKRGTTEAKMWKACALISQQTTPNFQRKWRRSAQTWSIWTMNARFQGSPFPGLAHRLCRCTFARDRNKAKQM